MSKYRHNHRRTYKHLYLNLVWVSYLCVWSPCSVAVNLLVFDIGLNGFELGKGMNPFILPAKG